MGEIYTTSYDSRLKEHSHYQLYPELLPLVGSHTKEVEKHFLFIGESHYVPSKRDDIHTDHENWYRNRLQLTETEIEWLTTREIISSGTDRKYPSRAHSIFRNLEKALLDSGMNPPVQDNMFRYCSFMNFFQRPACPNVSINESRFDKDIAFETVCHVAETISADVLIYVSKKAYLAHQYFVTKTEAKHQMLLPYYVVPHPTSSWWNRKSKSYKGVNGETHTGKEHLHYILTLQV